MALTEILKELFTKGGMGELFRFVDDSLYQIVSEIPVKQKSGYILDDPHVHYPYPSNKRELEETVRLMASKLGRSAITIWAMSPQDEVAVKSVLRYEDLVDVSNLGENISIDNRGEVSIIRSRDERLQVYPSQEIRTMSTIKGFEPHITAEGCLDPLKSGQDARRTIEQIHDLGGLAIIEHNATRTHPYFQYILTNPQEDAFTRELFEMVDATEVFNSYNTLWMALSNSKAKKEAEKYPIARIAGSDLHFGTSSRVARDFHKRRIGKTGIWLPDHDISSLTGREILELKRNDLRNGDYERLETYTDPLTFFVTMAPSIFYRKMAKLFDRLGVKHSLHGDSIS